MKQFVRSEEVNIGFQVVYLLLLFLLFRDTGLPEAGLGRDVALLALVLVPSAIWVWFFYWQDRLEPEPTYLVVLSFLAGMAVGVLAVIPLQEEVLNLRGWLYGSTTDLLLGSVFVIGGVTSALLYLTLRYGFLPHEEFDEPVDGMAYGSFLASGFAFVFSLEHLLDRPDFTLFAAGYVATTNVLVYASVGALIGYFVGKARFSEETLRQNAWKAVLTGTLLLAGYHVANEFIFVQGFAGAFWISFALSVLFAAGVLAFAYSRMRGMVTEDPGAARPVRVEYSSIALLVVFVLGGGVVQQTAGGWEEFGSEEHGVSFRYPGWLSTDAIGMTVDMDVAGQPVFTASTMGEEGGMVHFSVEVMEGAVEESNRLDFLPAVEPTELRMVSVTAGGVDGTRFHYGYLADPSEVGSDLPEAVWGFTDVVARGGRTYVFTFRATPRLFERERASYHEILNSVTWN